MTIQEKIQKTTTYCELVRSTPFLKTMLINKKNCNEVELICYQIQKFGDDYVKDKNYDKRSLRIASEIILNEIVK